MPTFGFTPGLITFGVPQLLWLLLAPAGLLILWVSLVSRRWRDRREIAAHQTSPARHRFALIGDLGLWLAVTVASASLIVALARPQTPVSRVRTAGIDLVVLADASASMYVEDVVGSRWQRAMEFLAVLGNALSWKDDRIAMALFAHIAAPQVRLTKDPNTFFFFLDHLSDKPPFRLEDDQTWDTNVELGIHWGLRLIAKDEELHGKSQNATAFVLLSDGQVWSGEVRKALEAARGRGIPVFVVGVGTTFGGRIPEPKAKAPVLQPYEHDAEPPVAPQHSALNRTSLRAIATASNGLYFELDRSGQREIANAIIDAARQRAAFRPLEEQTEELYWPFLVGSALCAALGVASLRERSELWLGFACAVAVALSLWRLFR